MAKIDIIIPAYNVENYIRKCLNSILNQSYDDFRIIIIEDCSTDNTLNIINEYEKKYPEKIVVIKNIINQGPATSRNKGLNICNAEYITFVDADDYIPQDTFLKVNSIIEKENPDIINFDIDLVFHGLNANFLGTRKKHINERKLINTREYKKHIYEERNSATGKYIKRELINNKFPDGIKWEDFAFIIPIVANAKSIYIMKETGYYYNVNPFGTTTKDMFRVPERLLDIFTCCDIINNNISDELKEHYKQELLSIKILNCIKRARDLSLTINLSKEEKILLTNYIINLTRIKEGDYENLTWHQYLMKNSKFYSIRISIMEQMLDNRLQQETNELVLKKSINEIIKKSRT